MEKQKKITRLCIETERPYVLEVEMGCSVDGARRAVLKSKWRQSQARCAYRLVEAGAIHFAEDPERRLRICLNSLTKGKDLLKEAINNEWDN